jgi:selenocysteine lyase/cysteine desulfurase
MLYHTFMDRRGFLIRTGLTLGAGAFATVAAKTVVNSQPSELADWEGVRNQFVLDPSWIHMSGFLLAPHPQPVREAIAQHRQGLDANPVDYLHSNQGRLEAQVLLAASRYLGVSTHDIALTDSTTMGLGLLYGGLQLHQDQEILSTIHDHYSTEISLRERAERSGASIRQIALYQNIHTVTVDEIVDTLIVNIRPETRVVAVTWVHSSTGLKLPIRAMADALDQVNANRDEDDRVLLSVDGVHALGVENVTLPELGCDFFVAGCHKWLFGPRGTGIVWGKPDAWPVTQPTIPTFDSTAYQVWMKVIPPRPIPASVAMTPGGFHSFEHRWALNEGFDFQVNIGKDRVQQRIHSLNRQLKEALAQMDHVTLYTPVDEALSAGIVCFDVRGLHATQVVTRLEQQRIIATITPYATLYARLSPSLLTSPEDVESTINAVAALR